jgi:dihydrofolate reductase
MDDLPRLRRCVEAAGGKLMQIVLIAAIADNGVIGRDGTMPWRLKSDMRHFRALTLDKPVIMGRRTYLTLSIKPLPRRTNIVVSRDRNFAAPGIVVAPSLEAALQAARGDALRRRADAIMVIGGAEIYAQAMPCADRLEITQIHAAPQGNARFPAIDPDTWRELARQQHPQGPGDDHAFDTVSYAREPRGQVLDAPDRQHHSN